MTAKFQLVVLQGPRRGKVFLLENSILIIGRDPLLDVALANPEVSRQHARMARDENGDYKIQDLGSTNGTFVNGQRLGGEPYTLQAGQEVVLGSSVILRYELATADEGAVPEEESAPGIETAVAAQPALAFDDDDALDAEFAEPDFLDDTGDLQEAPPPIDPVYTPEPQAKPGPDPTISFADPLPSPVGAAPFVPTGVSEKEQKRKRTITWIIATLLLLMLCCCGFLLSAWFWWGDPLMEALGVY